MNGGKTIITCAVTGNLTKPEQTPHLPITPQHIADECLVAARAGASAVHIHVRDPKTGRPSMDVELYRDVMKRIRAQDEDLIINLTTGPGGRFVPSEEDPKVFAPGTTLLPPMERVKHVTALKPDICSLDLNTMNSGPDVVINTPKNVRRMARVIREAGVKPELEIFDSGDIHMALDLIADGTLEGPAMWTFVLGVKYGFMPTPQTVMYARDMLPLAALVNPQTRIVEEWTMPQLNNAKVMIPFYQCGGHKVWGATAMVLCEFVTLIEQSMNEEEQ